MKKVMGLIVFVYFLLFFGLGAGYFIKYHSFNGLLKSNDRVENSRDGSVSQVQDYLKNNLRDWKSYESEGWSKVKIIPNWYMRYEVQHEYWTAYGLNKKILMNQVFYLDAMGRVVEVENAD
jgi:uncharacterized protein YxeA